MRPRMCAVWTCAVVFLVAGAAYRFWTKDWTYTVAIALILCLAASGVLGLHAALNRLGHRAQPNTGDDWPARGSVGASVSWWPILIALAAAAIIVGIAVS